MDFGPFGRSTRTLARALAGVGLPLLMYACGHGPTPAGPVAAWLDEQGKRWAFSRVEGRRRRRPDGREGVRARDGRDSGGDECGLVKWAR